MTHPHLLHQLADADKQWPKKPRNKNQVIISSSHQRRRANINLLKGLVVRANLQLSSNKSKTVKTSKKNKNYNHAYNCSELQTRSSEDEIFGYKDTEVKHELTSDLGWDPMTYYPNAAPQKAFVPKHIQTRVKQKEILSPTLIVQGQNDA